MSKFKHGIEVHYSYKDARHIVKAWILETGEEVFCSQTYLNYESANTVAEAFLKDKGEERKSGRYYFVKEKVCKDVRGIISGGSWEVAKYCGGGDWEVVGDEQGAGDRAFEEIGERIVMPDEKENQEYGK